MNRYAMLNADGYVRAIVSLSTPPESSHIALDAADDLPPAPPSEKHRLRRVSGTWTWEFPGGAEAKWADVRAERDAKLRATDWMGLSDVPTGAGVKQAWLAYRQQLRDITQQADPFNIVWPTPPG